MSTLDYKEYLETLISVSSSKDKDKKKNCFVKDYTDMSTDKVVEFVVQFNTGILNKLLAQKCDNGLNGVEKYLKLYTTQTTTNMHLFNDKEQLKKYEDVYAIIKEYYSIRLQYYNKRKVYLLDKLSKELVVLSNKAKYIMDILNDNIDLRKKTKEDINIILDKMKFDKDLDTGNYNYLIKMPMDSVSQENVDKLLKERDAKELELDIIKIAKVENIWLSELKNLKVAYEEFVELDEKENSNEIKTKKKSK